MSRRNRRGYRQLIEADLDIMPLMNLFVVLIPMLLLSAVFVELSVIDMNLPPADAEAQTASDERGLQLAVTIEANRYVVEGRRLARRVIDRTDAERSGNELASVLTTIVEDHPSNEEVVIVSQGDTAYQDLITVMDISRESGLLGISLAGAGQ